MSLLYIDASMGMSGIKLFGALTGCLAHPKRFIGKFNEIGLDGIRLESLDVADKGISGRILEFKRIGHGDYADEEDDDYEPHRSHHRHTLRTLTDVEEVINELRVSGNVRRKASAVYELIAQASAVVHEKDVNEVILYRTGSRDVIGSVVGVFAVLEELGCDKIISSPVAVGAGKTQTSRGETAIPIPIVSTLLDGVPNVPGTEKFEMCTTDGAALIKSIVEEFGEMPEIQVEHSGAGFGLRDYRTGVNCVRAYLGDEVITSANAAETEIEAELYSDTAASIEFAMDKLIKSGAEDVYTMPITSAVNGRGILLRVICGESDADVAAKCILQNTSALKVRRRGASVYEPSTKMIDISTSVGNIRAKEIEGFGLSNVLPLKEDVAAAAEKHGISYGAAYDAVIKDISK